ncbi:hypothetical protein IFR05_002116 [Cadophora sp. M221]|nr:hypothetical protein IFR05_002116 [Cadophora sp. M221]
MTPFREIGVLNQRLFLLNYSFFYSSNARPSPKTTFPEENLQKSTSQPHRPYSTQAKAVAQLKPSKILSDKLDNMGFKKSEAKAKEKPEASKSPVSLGKDKVPESSERSSPNPVFYYDSRLASPQDTQDVIKPENIKQSSASNSNFRWVRKGEITSISESDGGVKVKLDAGGTCFFSKAEAPKRLSLSSG